MQMTKLQRNEGVHAKDFKRRILRTTPFSGFGGSFFEGPYSEDSIPAC